MKQIDNYHQLAKYMNYYIFSVIIATVLLISYWILRQIKRQERYNKINGKLDRYSFEPDPNCDYATTNEVVAFDGHILHLETNEYFPWDDVETCFGNVLPRANFKNHKSCPKCKLASEQLVWIKFRSPKDTWQNLCGRSGPLSICPNCKIQVQFIMEVMN